jgi:hypothetical protein
VHCIVASLHTPQQACIAMQCNDAMHATMQCNATIAVVGGRCRPAVAGASAAKPQIPDAWSDYVRRALSGAEHQMRSPIDANDPQGRHRAKRQMLTAYLRLSQAEPQIGWSLAHGSSGACHQELRAKQLGAVKINYLTFALRILSVLVSCFARKHPYI